MTDQHLAEMDAAKVECIILDLALIAERVVPHTDEIGECPSARHPDKRNIYCPACAILRKHDHWFIIP